MPTSYKIARRFRFILGALDPEMMMIEKLLTEHNIPFVPAQVYKDSRLKRANHAECYRSKMSDGIVFPVPQRNDVWIECEPVGGKEAITAARGRFIDHHYPKDFGYGKPAQEHAVASSIAQLCNLLKIPMTPEILLASAIDHGLAAAYRGEIPGILPDDVYQSQVGLMILDFKRSRECIDGEIAGERLIIRNGGLPRLNFIADGNSYEIVDYREKDIHDSYEYLCVREAALLEGVGMLVSRVFRILNNPRKGEMFVAHMPPPVIRSFLEKKIYPHLEDRFGVPERSYAGGYLPRSRRVR